MAEVFLFVLSAAIAALGCFVWRARPESLVNRWFAAHTWCMGLWIVGIGGLQGGSNLESWGRFTFAAASLVPPTFLGFIRSYPTPSSWPSRQILRITLIIGVLLALVSLTTPLIVYDVALSGHGLTRKTGRLYFVFSAYLLVTIIAALAVFWTKWKRAAGLARAQLHYLGAGLIIPVAGGATCNLILPMLTGRSTYSWAGPYFSLVLVAFVGHAIIRHRLMDLRVVIHRSFAYAGVTAAISALIIILTRVASVWTEDHVSVQPDILVIAFVAAAILSPPGQQLFNRLINPYLYRGGIDHVSALRSAMHRLSRLMQPAEVAAELRRILHETFVPESFVMVLQRADPVSLEPIACDNPEAAELFTSAPTLATFFSSLSSTAALIVNPDLLKTAEHKATHEALRSAGIELIVSLGRRGQLLGTVLVGPKRSGDAYFARDLSFIESLCELGSIALENALLYRQQIHMLEYSERLLESLNSAVVAVDVDGKITSLNSAAISLLALTSETRGHDLSTVPSEIAWALALAVRGAWRPREVQANIEHPSRGLIPVILSTAAISDDRNEISGALVVVTDLSAVKALELNQRRIEHLAMMARFYAGIAHEIRSPLAAISNFIAMLPDRFDDPEYRDTAVRLLPVEVARIVRLADRLRLMAPSEDGKLSTVGLQSLLEDIVTLHSAAAAEQGVTVSLTCAPNLPTILGDRGQLVQLFVNLLKNAIEAMPSGGNVTIEALEIVTRTGQDRVVVRVIDEGQGIDPAHRARIFQPFFTTKQSGTGLGLSICREIADFHRARLALLPRIDQPGTVAHIEFMTATGDLEVVSSASRTPDPTDAV